MAPVLLVVLARVSLSRNNGAVSSLRASCGGSKTIREGACSPGFDKSGCCGGPCTSVNICALNLSPPYYNVRSRYAFSCSSQHRIAVPCVSQPHSSSPSGFHLYTSPTLQKERIRYDTFGPFVFHTLFYRQLRPRILTPTLRPIATSIGILLQPLQFQLMPSLLIGISVL